MNGLILSSQFLPLLGLLLILISQNDEHKIARISTWCSVALGVSIVVLLLMWGQAGFQNYEYEWFTLYSAEDYRFPVLFYLDRIGGVYLFCVWAIFSVIY